MHILLAELFFHLLQNIQPALWQYNRQTSVQEFRSVANKQGIAIPDLGRKLL